MTLNLLQSFNTNNYFRQGNRLSHDVFNALEKNSKTGTIYATGHIPLA